MATLYEINTEILSCIDMETGEVIDLEKLQQLQMQKDQKIENIACWIKNLESDAAAYKAEKDAFAERQKQAENKAAQLKQFLAYALEGNKFSSAKCAVRFRSSEAVEIPDETLVPKKWLIKTITFKPDKKAIKDAIKNGLKIKGCELICKLNAQIK